jgi:Actin like proteins N terminal domain
MNTYSFGYDFGNAETCGVTYKNGRKIMESMPTAVSRDSGSRLLNIGVSMRPDHYIIQMDGKRAEFFIGSLALEQGSDIWNGYGDPGRYWSSKSLMSLLTLASSMIPDEEFKMSVVTGIPVESYSGNPANRQLIRDALSGTHTFTINKQRRIIHINVDKVIMEGAGAAIAYGSAKGRQGMVDIGGRTTDLYASNGQSPDLKYCHGTPIGVQTAMDNINSSFEQMYGVKLEKQFLRDLMYAYSTEQSLPFAYVRGEKIWMESFVSESVEQTVESLVSFIRSKWRSNESDTAVASGFERVTVVGGGAYYFFSQIKRDIPHATCAE